MNKSIKELTEAAMMLALFIVIAIIDRYLLANFFDIYLVLLESIIVFMHLMKYKNKQYVLMFVFGFILMSFLIQSIVPMVYAIPAALIGYLYALFYQKRMDKKYATILSGSIMAIYELVAVFLILPIFGQSVESFMQSYESVYQSVASFRPQLTLIPSTFLLVVIEVVFAYLQVLCLSMGIEIVLKRFKQFKGFSFQKSEQNYRNSLLANLSIACIILVYIFQSKLNNDMIYILVTTLAVVCAVNLSIFGIIYILQVMRYLKQQRFNLLVGMVYVFLMPISLLLTLVVGYLSLTNTLRIDTWKNLKN